MPMSSEKRFEHLRRNDEGQDIFSHSLCRLGYLVSVIPLKQFQMNVRTKRGRPSVILKGDLNEKAAWKLLKQLETFQPSMYPINLEVDGIETIHWFAVKILKAGFEHLFKTRGQIFLIQKSKKPQPISEGNFPFIISPAKGDMDGG